MVADKELSEGVRPPKQLHRHLECGEANLGVIPPQFPNQVNHYKWNARRIGPKRRNTVKVQLLGHCIAVNQVARSYRKVS